MTAEAHEPEVLAQALKVKLRYVMEHYSQWPHTRVGRYVRFTDDQIEDILKMQAVDPAPPVPTRTGRATRAGAR